jgi:hypothetical protein
MCGQPRGRAAAASLVALSASLCLASSAPAQVTVPQALPQVRLPQTTTPQIQLPQPVQDVVKQLPLNLSPSTGQTPANPSTPSPGASTPSPTTPAPSSGSSPSTSRSAPRRASSGSSRPATPTRSRRQARTRAAAARSRARAATAAAAARRRAARRARPAQAAKRTGTTRSLPRRIADTVAGAPVALLVAALALGLLGVAMAGRSMLATARARRLSRQRGELREDVGALSAAVLPAVPESVAGVAVDVAYRPAEGPAAGGDFHDVLELEGGRLGVLIGDVSGHGRRALASTPLVHYTVRAYLEAGLAPREALKLADRTLDGKLGEDFVTVACGIYDPAHARFDYAVAGHPVPVLTGPGKDHAVELMTPAPVGLGPPTGFRQTSVPIRPGQSICLFSDGVVENREEADGPLLGREGLAALLSSGETGTGAHDLLEHLSADTTAGGDDMTVCLLTPENARGRGPVVEELEVGPRAAPIDKLDEFGTRCGLNRGQMAAVREALEDAGEGAVLRIERQPGRTLWGVESAAQRLAAALPDQAV